MATLHTRRCTECGTEYDVLRHRGEEVGIDVDDPVCTKCAGEEYSAVLKVGQGVELGDVGGAGKHYPYFDRALNMEIQSAAHRREVVKARGLVAVEGDFDSLFDEQVRADRRALEETERANAEHAERLEHDPQYADYRKLRDRGEFDPKKPSDDAVMTDWSTW